LLGNPAIFSSKIQTSAYDGNEITKTAVKQKEKDKSKGNLHRNISQADSTMPRIKELHSS
jgi:hypothetical protein